MKQKDTQKRTDIFELAERIDREFSARESQLLNQLDELQVQKDRLAKEKAEFELTKESFTKEKAEFAVISEEVNTKFSKIRNDEQLTATLKEQAIERKANEKMLADSKENLTLAELKLAEVGKRELALSLREAHYKEELEKKFVGSFFKG